MILRRSLSKFRPFSLLHTSSLESSSITLQRTTQIATITTLQQQSSNSQSSSSSHLYLTTAAAASSNSQSSPSSSHIYLTTTAAAAALLATTTTTSHSDASTSSPPPPHNDIKGWNMLSIQQRRRHFFKYEKRIREFSSPEKVFEYFASINSNKSDHTASAMTPSDMMRSVIAVYPPEGSDIIRGGSLPGEPSPNVSQEESTFFKAFDIDSDAKVEFDEWLLFQALLSVPIDDVAVAFSLMDTNGDGTVDQDEFQTLLTAITKRAAYHQQSISRHKSLVDKNGLQSAQGGLMKLFFGKSGKEVLSLAKLQKFILDMRDELARLEFSFYDYDKKGYITGKDFAYTVIGCARMKNIDDYLNRIENMPNELSSIKVSLKDFQVFRSSWRKLHQLSVALEFWYHSAAGAQITPEDFQKVVCRSLGAAVSKDVVDVLFYLFESTNGGLNVDYLLALMDRHVETGLQVSRGDETAKSGGGGGGGGDGKSFFDCLSKCTSK